VTLRVSAPRARRHSADVVADDRSARRRAIGWVVAFAVIAAALRLPYVWTGLSTDEGGYAYVAQQWSRGAQLYGRDWIDRPQGLLLTYRGLLALGESGWAIRGLVVLIGALMTLLVAAIGGLLAGRRLAVAAAGVYAVIAVAPHLYGFTLNGELLSSVPATAAVAVALWWRRSVDGERRPAGRGRIAWLVLAGVLAGIGLTMKQSGFDGLVVVLAVAAGVRAPWLVRLGRAMLVAVSFAVPVGACVIDGIHRGWSMYWNAILGYQLSTFGGSLPYSADRWHDFLHYLPLVLWDIGAVIVVAVLGLVLFPRGSRWPLIWWLIAATIGINLGGSYWTHYYVQAIPPLVLAASYVVVAASQRLIRIVVAVVLVVPALAWMAAVLLMSPTHRAATIPYDKGAANQRKQAAVIDAMTTPDQSVYVFYAEPLVYFLSHRTTSYPYLWGIPIRKIPAALPEMRSMLASPARPTLVIMTVADPNSLDPTGGVKALLREHYHYVGTVAREVILRAN
jgi:4-amino-4-deoxy-L-arabinose transferase-like glycosyltransferase